MDFLAPPTRPDADKTARHQIVVMPRVSTAFTAPRPIDHRHTDMTEAIGQLSLLFQLGLIL